MVTVRKTTKTLPRRLISMNGLSFGSRKRVYSQKNKYRNVPLINPDRLPLYSVLVQVFVFPKVKQDIL